MEKEAKVMTRPAASAQDHPWTQFASLEMTSRKELVIKIEIEKDKRFRPSQFDVIRSVLGPRAGEDFSKMFKVQAGWWQYSNPQKTEHTIKLLFPSDVIPAKLSRAVLVGSHVCAVFGRPPQTACLFAIENIDDWPRATEAGEKLTFFAPARALQLKKLCETDLTHVFGGKDGELSMKVIGKTIYLTIGDSTKEFVEKKSETSQFSLELMESLKTRREKLKQRHKEIVARQERFFRRREELQQRADAILQEDSGDGTSGPNDKNFDDVEEQARWLNFRIQEILMVKPTKSRKDLYEAAKKLRALVHSVNKDVTDASQMLELDATIRRLLEEIGMVSSK